MTSTVTLIVVTWITLGLVVIGVLNLAKWAVRTWARPRRADLQPTAPWPAPRPVPGPELETSGFGSKRSAA